MAKGGAWAYLPQSLNIARSAEVSRTYEHPGATEEIEGGSEHPCLPAQGATSTQQASSRLPEPAQLDLQVGLLQGSISCAICL